MPVDEEQRLRARAGDDGFVRRVVLAVLIAGALVTLGLLLWALVDVLLLVFGAVLVATMLHALADPIARRTPLSRTAALPLAALVILAVVGTAVWLFHAQVSGQIVDAVSKAQSGLPALAERLGVPGLAGQIVDTAHRVLSGDALLGRVTTVGATVLEATTNLVLVVFGGAYLAAAPTVYRDGVVKLFPAAARPRVGETLDTAGRALKLWLLGQAAAMIVTGALTWLGLWIIGVPSAAGLGLIAGVMELIPLVGPFLAAVPAILVALSQDASMAAWTVLVFILVQQVEFEPAPAPHHARGRRDSARAPALRGRRLRRSVRHPRHRLRGAARGPVVRGDHKALRPRNPRRTRNRARGGLRRLALLFCDWAGVPPCRPGRFLSALKGEGLPEAGSAM